VPQTNMMAQLQGIDVKIIAETLNGLLKEV
jgi:hypothetical protein